MSSGWDFNGDGKSDYVDYKIFNTQINPYSGEYEGYNNQYSRSGSPDLIGSLLSNLILGSICVAIGIVVYIVFSNRIFLFLVPTVILTALYPWKKIEKKKIPIRKPYNYVCAIYAVCVFFLYLSYRGPYFRQPASGASLILGLGVLFGAFLKRDKRLVIVGLFSLLSGYIIALIYKAPGEQLLLAYCLSIISLFFLVAAISLPKNKMVAILSMICPAICFCVSMSFDMTLIFLIALLLYVRRFVEKKA